ncbi:MAG: Unknown protein [uncultured Campylobacterales bacterium]|uniref:Uncharacterized protein n=1 Tax=uncultured Campylobacterales bacterium TaxID=352960 RepID=A0A6S6SQP1_9BACT|nr:MAG: Unknown protein [uncultured Campylobacterales bacterium]
MNLETIIGLKNMFSILGAVLVGLALYFGLDGHKYGLLSSLLTSCFILLIPFFWNKSMHTGIVNKSRRKEISYKTFEIIGLLIGLVWFIFGIILWINNL